MLRLMMVAALVAVALPAAAHSAPTPMEPMVRILHDYNDDWGGHAANRPGFDLMALDVSERYRPDRNERVLVLRLILDGRPTGENASVELRLSAAGTPVAYHVWTTDGETYGHDVADIAGPSPLLLAEGTQDGSRFVLDLIVAAGTDARFPIGAQLTGFFAQARVDGRDADHMVGGYTVDGQRTDEPPASEVADPASYRRPSYTIEGPIRFASLAVPKAQIEAGCLEPATLDIRVKNLLSRPQTASLNVIANSTTLVWVDSRLETMNLDLDARETVEAALSACTDQADNATIVLTTEFGGRLTATLRVEPGPNLATKPAPSTAMPWPIWPALLALLLAGATRSRRP